MAKNEIKNSIYLSSLLYEVGEIKSTLLNCVINKDRSSVDEIIFWVNELWSSGFKKLWNFIWKIFYDFYAFYNQDIIHAMIKLQKDFNDVDESIHKDHDSIKLKIMSSVFILLSRMKKSPMIFITRHKVNDKNILFKDISKYSKLHTMYNCKTVRDKLFIQSLHYKKINEPRDKVHINDCLYFISVSEKTLDSYIKLYERYYNKKFIKNPYYNDNKHLLLFYIIAIRNNCYAMDKINEYKPLLSNNEIQDIINQVDVYIKDNNRTDYNPFHYFKVSRKYTIHPVPGILTSLSSLNTHRKLEMLRNDWTYYIYKTPIWKKRIQVGNHRIIKKSNMFIVSFNSLDDEITFYDKYNYDPDEQSLDTQMKSISNDNINLLKWLHDSFKFSTYIISNKSSNLNGMNNSVRY